MNSVARSLALGVLLVVAGQPVPAISGATPRVTAVQEPGANPLSGKWVANLARSERHSNHRFKSAALDIAVDGNTVTITHSGVNAGGQQESGTVVLQADGREHAASPKAPDVVTTTRWKGPRRLETVASRGESVIGNQIYEVSPDGNTLTATVSGIDASGRSFEQVIVFERQ